MSKPKQTSSDKRGSRAQRNPRDSPKREQSSAEPPHDRDSESDGVVDEEMELDTDKYERPAPK